MLYLASCCRCILVCITVTLCWAHGHILRRVYGHGSPAHVVTHKGNCEMRNESQSSEVCTSHSHVKFADCGEQSRGSPANTIPPSRLSKRDRKRKEMAFNHKTHCHLSLNGGGMGHAGPSNSFICASFWQGLMHASQHVRKEA